MASVYAVTVAVAIALLGTYGIITMQPLAAFILIGMILVLFFTGRFFDSIRQSLTRIEQRLENLEKK